MIVMLFACLEPKSIQTDVIPYGDPDIEEITYECDPSTARWTFEATTDAWTANGNIWLYIDPVLEKHPIYSINAAADGSADTLGLTLSVVADWRDASTGSSTQFQCADFDDLGLRLYVYHPETAEAADCETTGAEVDWDSSSAPSCNQ
ncbi:MAG: hypothetical protein VXZ96_18775 [Myxococcota bacterium]|nr:hypothetical protein [Myxococcota bacterium]